jgi:16S rRNA (cytosine967-C5)-methyltransferase
VLTAVVSDGQSADAVLGRFDASPDRAAVRAIALGSIRWYLRLWPAVEGLLARATGVSPAIRSLLVVGAHQVVYSQNPPELSVHAAVDAARIMKSARATGFVNAVLRRFVREHPALLARVDVDVTPRTAHPAWLVEALRSAWPGEYEAILAANNRRGPMTLRMDLSRLTASAYVDELASLGIESQTIQWMPSAVLLDHPLSIRDLPRFADGAVSVQDAGAQLAAVLLDPRPGMRVLDACAAPGGKTGHLLEHAGEGLDLTAIDLDGERLARVEENLQRLRRRARVMVADATSPESFWDGRPFERILVDAPCSATGVIRRHPDVKLLRRETDQAGFASQQLAILRAAARMLARGGRLLYSTCSVLPVENEAVVAQLLTEAPELKPRRWPVAGIPPPGARELRLGLQLLPGNEAGTDGFYYACLEKTTTGP